MNTFVLSLACLATAQVQPSRFDPAQVISPARSAPIAVEPNAVDRGGSIRLTDQKPARRTATRAQAEAPVVPVHSTSSEALAAMILDGAMDMPIAGTADVPLVDLLRRIGDSSSRQRAVQSYWRLCLAIAEQNFARHEARYLSELARPQSQLEDSLLTAEVTQARARQATAALKVLELQETLSDVGRLETTGLPRPVDRPFVGPYRTHIETLFANRTVPKLLQRIDRRLPHQLEVIERRADAVAAGQRAASQLAEAYQGRAASLSAVLDALAQLSRTRRELLAAVLSYNEQIAEYSFAVVRPGVAPESLLGTLIRREMAAPATMLADNHVRPASAETPVLESGQVDGSHPLRPTPDPQSPLTQDRAIIAPSSRSILKRVTIDHP